MKELLGVDVGTTALKAVILDEAGRIVRTAVRTYPTSHPYAGWSEQNPEDWWNAYCECARELSLERVAAIGLTGQMHGSVFLDANGNVIRPALLWNDQRTYAECDEIDHVVGRDVIREITLNPPLTGFQVPKILWLRNHELSKFQRVSKVLLPKDYVRWKLSGTFASDVSDSSGVGALDVRARKWSAAVLSSLELDPDLFPPLYESTALCAVTENGVPIVCGAGDQAAAAVGTGTIVPGIVSLSLGTSGVVFACIDEQDLAQSDAVHTFCHANGGWHRMGVMLSCGGAVAWSRETFLPDKTFAEFDAAAAKAEVGAGGVRFLPYLAGERCPHNNPHASAALVGLTLRTTPAEIARASLEGVSFGLKDCVDAVCGLPPKSVRVSGGGAKSTVWLQILADVLRTPVEIVSGESGPAVGAAILAGVGIGLWPSLEDAVGQVVGKPQLNVNPGPNDYSLPLGEWRALYRKMYTS